MTALLLLLLVAGDVFADSKCRILLLEPRTTSEQLRRAPFLREFGRDTLRTSTCTLDVTTVDHLDEKRLRQQVDEAVASAPSVLVAPASRIALFVGATKTTIPTLFVSVANPGLIGLVADPARPEANLTGVTHSAFEHGKLFELARELAGAEARVGLLVDKFWPTLAPMQAALERARTELGIDIAVFAADDAAQARALVARPGRRVDVWVILDTPLGRYHGKALVGWLRQRGGVVLVENEELLSEGAHLLVRPNVENPMRTLAEMADLVLTGVPVTRIPVARPRRFNVVLNMPEVEATPGVKWREILVTATGFRREGERRK